MSEPSRACPLAQESIVKHPVISEDANGHLDQVAEDLKGVVEAECVAVLVIVADEVGSDEGAQQYQNCEEDCGDSSDDDW